MNTRGRQSLLGDSLRSVLGRLNKKSGGGADSARVGRAWATIVGSTVQGHTTGAHMRDGTLIIYVDSPLWATELTAMSERYRGAINQEVGEELVRSVRFTVSRKVSQQHRIVVGERETDDFYSEDKVPSVALSPTELARVVASVEAISDEELREAVLRATVKDLEWKKGIATHSSREEPRERL